MAKRDFSGMLPENSPTQLRMNNVPEDVPTRPKGIPSKEIVKLRKQGYTHKQIGKFLDCSATNVRKRLKAMGLTNVDIVDDHRKYEPDILTAHRHKIDLEMARRNIKKVPFESLGKTRSLMLKDEKLLLGEPTAIVGYADLLEAKRLRMKELENLNKEMGEVEVADG